MKVFYFLACFFAVSLAEVIQLSPQQINEAELALHNPDMYDGDMNGFVFDEERNARPGEHYRWINARVPYVIDSSLGGDTVQLIKKAFDDYHKNTCVRFVPRSNERDYIRMFRGDGCWSYVGRIDNQQDLSLASGCWHLGIIVHELGHALGFFHEHSRSDRDEYLILYLENVEAANHRAFRKLSPHENILYNGFDYDSIMLYSNTHFSKNGKTTMVARNGKKLVASYLKSGMSSSDIERVKKMYRC